ncbi:MAG: carbamoyl-phosphate synthase large subunit [Candidatus Nanopelagicaceae bacterium]|nr:carbamoyl-phosphate synthase large subunit [Actinomycetota bacterium]NCV43427.1 carbamoyl-phosphate synthase large subunit [Actinomycetota bacterium]NCV83254.1 carbamoyl-phosphate synthase large subunit [Actinomycetota bacterium]NCW93630.1 carbamoyl-phosphate synthase large subunit [Actinomycetota bacterium]NCW96174.1 carbamoyl-phosphate synthase large subunit [Actinomycetota bacterium]
MPKDNSIKSVLVIGSGPIVIGQACEFDYSGTQACRVLRAEGVRVVLVNSNPATIMTDPEFADATYVEPITPEYLESIIAKEKPDAILATLGGQTALNAAMKLDELGILAKYQVRLIGADIPAIKRGENREEFRTIVEKVGGESARSIICHEIAECLEAAKNLNYPVVVRPSFTMGGLGSGIAYNEAELRLIAGAGLQYSPVTEVLLEESIIGWKEYELEVMRDHKDNVVIVCSIENVDPMGVHTGDSITVAPALTLTDVEFQKLRNLAISIIREVGVATGGCNIQFAVNPRDGRIVVIEMNPRVSRSSALASKATGFPIAKIATKLAIGYSLDEIPNDITEKTPASFEPTLDYIVVKIPRFAFEKFPEADQRLTTTMKSVGEAMAMGRSFPEALQKALRSLEKKGSEFNWDFTRSKEELLESMKVPTEFRLQEVQQGMALGASINEVHVATGIDPWFLAQIQRINELAEELKSNADLNLEILRRAKRIGFSDRQIGRLRGIDESEVRALRWRHMLRPVYKTVDTCAGEFEAFTPYHYSSYDLTSEIKPRTKPAIIILGSGPNRIGQGIEFDYSCVHACFALSEAGYETIMINCNPETVSTDYDTSDRLYFEPLTLEDVLEVFHAEASVGPVLGVITQLGGQTPLGLAAGLAKEGVPIIGTSVSAIHKAEDRGEFGEVLKKTGLNAPAFGTAFSYLEAKEVANSIGYPVLVRPSFVLGGRGMEIVYDEDSLHGFIDRATEINPDHPVLIDRFLDNAIEIDVDALFDGDSVYLAGIMEHIEEAGVHSGDSACVIPPQSISESMTNEIFATTEKLARAIDVRGLLNVQYAISEGKLFVIEANPRASRTVPYVSKATGVSLAKAAALIAAGKSIAELRDQQILPKAALGTSYGIAVKEAVLPWNRFRRLDGKNVDSTLGPEMKSTGEVMGIAPDFGSAFAKSQIAAFGALPKSGNVFISLADKDKSHAVESARALYQLGFKLFATAGTKSTLAKEGIETQLVMKHSEKSEIGNKSAVDLIESGEINLVINTPFGRDSKKDGWLIRSSAVARGIPCITTVPGLKAAVAGIRALRNGPISTRSLQDWTQK